MFGIFFQCFCCFLIYVVWWFLTCLLDFVFWLVLMCLAVFLVVARSWLFEVRVKQVDHEGINGFWVAWTISWTEKPSASVELSEMAMERKRERERCLLCPSMGVSQLDATGGSSHGSFPGTMHSHGGALQLYVNPGYRVTKEQISEANVFSIFHQFFVDTIVDECDSNK